LTILAEAQIGPHQGIRHNPTHCQLSKKATRNTDCLGSDNLLPEDRIISTSQSFMYIEPTTAIATWYYVLDNHKFLYYLSQTTMLRGMSLVHYCRSSQC